MLTKECVRPYSWRTMPKPSHRTKLLNEGLRVMHERGFNGASVRYIVQAAGVPQGSFTNHFPSKEAFAMEVVDLHFEQARALIERTLDNAQLDAIGRLHAYFDAVLTDLTEHGVEHGSLLGNLALETAEHSEALRMQIAHILDHVEQRLSACIAAAIDAGAIHPPTTEPLQRSSSSFAVPAALARYVQATLQGAVLIAKTMRDPEPVALARDLLFATALR